MGVSAARRDGFARFFTPLASTARHLQASTPRGPFPIRPRRPWEVDRRLRASIRSLAASIYRCNYWSRNKRGAAVHIRPRESTRRRRSSRREISRARARVSWRGGRPRSQPPHRPRACGCDVLLPSWCAATPLARNPSRAHASRRVAGSALSSTAEGRETLRASSSTATRESERRGGHAGDHTLPVVALWTTTIPRR